MNLIECWTSVIENAVRDVIEPGPQGACFEEQVGAYRWIMSDSYEPCSFMWACALLDISDDTVAQIRLTVSERNPIARYKP